MKTENEELFLLDIFFKNIDLNSFFDDIDLTFDKEDIELTFNFDIDI